MKKLMVAVAAVAAIVFAAKAESVTFTVPQMSDVTRTILVGDMEVPGDDVTVEAGASVTIVYRAYRAEGNDVLKVPDRYFFAGEAGGTANLTIVLASVTDKELAEGAIDAAIQASPKKSVSDAVCRRGNVGVAKRKFFCDLQEAIDKKTKDDPAALYLIKDIVVTDWIDLRTENSLFLTHHTITKGEPWENPDHNALIRVSAASNINGYGVKPGTDPKDGEYIPAQLLFPGDLDYAILANDELHIGGFGSGSSSAIVGGERVSTSQMILKGNKAAICVACESKSDLVELGYDNQFVCEEEGGAGIVLEKGCLAIEDRIEISGETGVLASGKEAALAITGDVKITGEKVGVKVDGCELAGGYFGSAKNSDRSLSIYGGTITATEDDGIALEIVNHGNTTATIIGGTFVSEQGQAVVSKGEDGAEALTGFIELGSIAKGTSYFRGATETPKEYIDTPIQGWKTVVVGDKEYKVPVVGDIGWPASWPEDVDEVVKGKFAAWKEVYGVNVDELEGKEWAFLLNVDPKEDVKELHIISITPDYNASQPSYVPKFVVSADGVNLGNINGILYLTMGKELYAREDAVNAVDPATNLPKLSGNAFTGKVGKYGDEWGEGNLLVEHVGTNNNKGYCSYTSGFFQAKIDFKAPVVE